MDFSPLTPLIAATLTSLAACWLGARRLGLSPAGVGPAAARALALFGLAILFLAINVAAGIAVVVTARALTPANASLYFVGDLLVVISLLQALTFAGWLGRRK